jgi:hypothetical protein
VKQIPLIQPNMNFEQEPFNFYPENDYEKAISEICDEIKETLIKKNRDYGDSFSKLYQEYGDLSVVIRLSDKLERYKNLISNDNLVKDESKEDTLKDTAGYSILTLASKRTAK